MQGAGGGAGERSRLSCKCYPHPVVIILAQGGVNVRQLARLRPGGQGQTINKYVHSLFKTIVEMEIVAPEKDPEGDVNILQVLGAGDGGHVLRPGNMGEDLKKLHGCKKG